MKDDFFIKIETWHKPNLGTLENISCNSSLLAQKSLENGITVFGLFCYQQSEVTCMILATGHLRLSDLGETSKQPEQMGFPCQSLTMTLESTFVKWLFLSAVLHGTGRE